MAVCLAALPPGDDLARRILRGVSKAFVNEDAQSVEPSARVARRGSGETRYITPEGQHRLIDELNAARAALAQTSGSPDKVARADLEAKVAVLVDTLDSVTVVASAASEDRAFFGAWVELEDEDGQRTQYRLVGPDEVDVKAGLVSVESPLGRALLGKSVGDEVSVQRPRGAIEYTVTAIRYQT